MCDKSQLCNYHIDSSSTNIIAGLPGRATYNAFCKFPCTTNHPSSVVITFPSSYIFQNQHRVRFYFPLNNRMAWLAAMWFFHFPVTHNGRLHWMDGWMDGGRVIILISMICPQSTSEWRKALWQAQRYRISAAFVAHCSSEWTTNHPCNGGVKLWRSKNPVGVQ